MRIFRSSILITACAVAALAQTPAVVSPEVHPDKMVTFRIAAPKATEVSLVSDGFAPTPGPKFTKDAKGVWSLTVGPLEPSIYIYSFNVDGVVMADPINPRMKLRASTSANFVEVPPDAPAFWSIRDVPHGKVDINYAKSSVLGDTRQVYVYTPPGYDKDRGKKFPVLYLFHGNNDTAAGWTSAGYANYILDNLIAEKKAVPMIVVMPFGHAAPYGARGGAGGRGNNELFEDYVIKDVIPMVETNYRTEKGRDKRSVAGLSMGGGQALRIGFAHLDLFSSVGAFSAAIPADFETANASSLKDSKGLNAKLKVFWIGCGKQDSLFARSQSLSDNLTKGEIKHTFRAIEGVHNFTAWKKFLNEYASMLFH
jgi:enterochelin esterase family protein